MIRFDRALFGSVMINGKAYGYDMVASWDGGILERQRSHSVTRSDMLGILQRNPEIVIVGTGHSSLMKVEKDAEVAAITKGVELIVEPTPKAIETFNKLAGKKKAIVVLHVTC